MKKNLIVMSLIFAMSGSQATLAAEPYENLSYETAIELNANETYSDNLESSSVEKWYKVTINEAGYISLNFVHDFLDSSARYWKAYLYDSKQEKLAEYIFNGNVTSNKMGNIGVSAGEYYIKITDYDGYSEGDYSIQVNYSLPAPFPDVNDNEWYTESVRWAVENGITSGLADNQFAPDQNCTRSQIVTFLYRVFGEK